MPQDEAYEYVCTGCGNTARAPRGRPGPRRQRCDACRAKERPGIARNTYECEACGASLAGRAANTRFCNQNCQKWARYNPGKKRPPPSASRTCLSCGTAFPRCGLKEFCSPLCSEVFHGNSKIGPRGGVITCAICGERKAVYMPQTSKACGDCLPEWRARQIAKWRGANHEKEREYGREYNRQRNKTPEYRDYMAAYMRRRRAAGLSGEGLGLTAVLAQHGSVCHLCLQPIEADADSRGPRAATRDHVIPLSKGGPDVIENLRPAHRSCNMWKGTKSVEEYLEPPVDVGML